MPQQMPVRLDVHHVGYAVRDLRASADAFARTVGGGPFFELPEMTFDDLRFEGGPAMLRTSAAFGLWGDRLIELAVLRAVEPEGLSRALDFGAPGTLVSHVGCVVDDLDAESARLVEAGLPLLQVGGPGPVRANWHDARDLLGHHVEVLQRTPQLTAFHELVREAGQGAQDGGPALRPAPLPDQTI